MNNALPILVGASLASVMGTWACAIFAGPRVAVGGAVVVVILSLATIVFSLGARRPVVMLPAVMHICLCVGLALLIVLAKLNADQAHATIIYAGLGYLAFAVPASIFAYAKASGPARA